MPNMIAVPSEMKVRGWFAPGYEGVVDAFAANLAGEEELGAACAVCRGGELVVDLWGGIADDESGRVWEHDTIVPVYSVTKGVAALCILLLVERGLLDLDEAVIHYWPEFGQHGKHQVTVRDLLAHRGGVPFIDGEISLEDIGDPVYMAERLARQVPLFEPGTAHAYHAITVGWLTSELVRRVTGQHLGDWLQQQLAQPLNLSMFIGLPDTQRSRVARLVVSTPEQIAAWPTLVPDGSVAWKTLTLNGLAALMPGVGGLNFNDFPLQSVQLAGANLVSDARSLAKFYAAFIDNAESTSLLSAETRQEAIKPVSTGVPYGTDVPGPAWGAGVMIPWSVQPMLGPQSFGHDGFGGSLAFADPDAGISFAYVRNKMAVGGVKDPAVYRVVDALQSMLSTC